MSLQKAKKKKSSYKIAFSDSENDDDNAKGKAEETTVEMDDLEDSVEEDEGVKLAKCPNALSQKLMLLDTFHIYHGEGHELVIASLLTHFDTLMSGSRDVVNAAEQTGDTCGEPSPKCFNAPMHAVR